MHLIELDLDESNEANLDELYHCSRIIVDLIRGVKSGRSVQVHVTYEGSAGR